MKKSHFQREFITCNASMAVPNDKEARNTKADIAPTTSTLCHP